MRHYNLSKVEQVIGRAIRYQSHQGLELDKRNVKIYIHISSLFESTSEKLSLLEKIKSKKNYLLYAGS